MSSFVRLPHGKVQNFVTASTIMATLGMFQPNPQDTYHLRLHRARSVVLTPEELVEIRAAQRTFEGAYIRTALSQFSFSLIVLKIFTAEFYGVGALFAVYGACVMLLSLYRRWVGNRQFFSEKAEGGNGDAMWGGQAGQGRKMFRTSGGAVVGLTALSLCAYIVLLALTLRLTD